VRLASSEFWRNLANEFRSVRAEKAFHWAEWNSPGPDFPSGWALAEHYPFKMEFLPLALRAAHALTPDAPNPWFAWLDALKNYNPPSLKVVDKSRGIGVLTSDGREAIWVAGELHNLGTASADFCKGLEIAAILNEAAAAQKDRELTVPANILEDNDDDSVPTVRVRQVETTGHEIERLRTESRITVERLAELMDLDPSTVSRHQTSDLKPSLRHLGRYDRVFSKLLGRKIVIGKTQ